jgi:hypothetical protein
VIESGTGEVVFEADTDDRAATHAAERPDCDPTTYAAILETTEAADLVPG